jgi:hypothetical protein
MGRAQTTGPMVLGDDVVFGVEPFTSRSRDILYQPGRKAYQLRCMSLKPPRNDQIRRGHKKNARNRQGGAVILWDQAVGARINALVRAGDRLFAAGAPDEVNTADPYAPWQGRTRGSLSVFECADGTPTTEIQLPAPPVWDGMAAAQGALYVALADGTLVCLR